MVVRDHAFNIYAYSSRITKISSPPDTNRLCVCINLYIWLTISSCYSSIPLTLGLIGRDGGLSTLCHSCGFACQQRVLKTFPGPGYLHSEDGVVWLCHLLVNLYIWLTISSCYGSIPLTLGLIGRDGGFTTLCHMSLLWGWGSLTISLITVKFAYNIYIYIYIYIYIHIYLYILKFWIHTKWMILDASN